MYIYTYAYNTDWEGRGENTFLADTGEKPLASNFQQLAGKYFLKNKSRRYLPIKAMLQMEGTTILPKCYIGCVQPPLLLASASPATNTYSNMIFNNDNGGSLTAEPLLWPTIPVYRITGTTPGHTVPLHRL